MGHVNKVSHVFTLGHVAEMLGEDEDWLFDVAEEMDTEDGQLWVVGVGEDGVMAFTDDGIENLTNLIAIHKDDPAVRDVEEGTRWYKMLLGREPDTQPMKGLVEWQFDAGGWLQVNENKQLAGRSSVTFVETDLDDRIKQLKKAGIEPKSASRGEQVSVVIITDPDGNQVVFAQGRGERHRAVVG